jgi:hypothetical protein
MLKVWLDGYALGITSARRWEQRIREDLGLRYWAGGQEADNEALSAFRPGARAGAERPVQAGGGDGAELGMGGLGMMALDSRRAFQPRPS